jgi:DNA invertase Pin-like site-specific DNA recombinase
MDRIFIYLRVSTDLQNEESQIGAINEFLITQNVQVIGDPFVDHALSGKIGIVRPQFNEMLHQLDDVDGICVFDWDRLTRDEEVGVMLMYSIRRKGKKVYEARTRNVLTFEPMSERILTVIKSMMAEEERHKIHDRQAAGIQAYINNYGLWGRKIKKINWKRYDEYMALELPKTNIAKLLGISVKTLYRRLKEKQLEIITGY